MLHFRQALEMNVAPRFQHAPIAPKPQPVHYNNNASRVSHLAVDSSSFSEKVHLLAKVGVRPHPHDSITLLVTHPRLFQGNGWDGLDDLDELDDT